MKRKFESEAMQVVYEEWVSMHRSGIVTDEEMQEIDELCFGEEDEPTPEDGNSRKKEEATAAT